MYRPFRLLIYISFAFSCFTAHAQPLNKKEKFTREDTLRGSNGPGRDWWDVKHYSINITPDYPQKRLSGKVEILYTVKEDSNGKPMQIDLQQPMQIDSVQGLAGNKFSFRREGNVYYIDFGKKKQEQWLTKNDIPALHQVKIWFSGKPRKAVNPPWDGGWIWTRDNKGRPWMTVACQGLGASVWYPCKDYQGDEPDSGAILAVTVPDSLSAVGNGRLISKNNDKKGYSTWTWQVKSPINNYNIVPYIGKYAHLTDTYTGEKGEALSLDYWVLDYDSARAEKQFGRDVKRMLKAFEYWFGPYPFYEDGYKLVESPHLGMEHQSAVAYGNHFLDGYLGMDLSGSGWGKKWDYIIIHESGHEWFANNITTKDIADMWVHEGFTMYSEVLFTEYYYGKKAADEYLQGIRNNISNDRPLIGPYGVNKEGSGDMYNKGASLLHTIRQVIHNDSLFREILRGLNKEFWHQAVDTKEIEDYFSRKSGKDLSGIFDQYLRSTEIPVLEYKTEGNKLHYRWSHCMPGFHMPLLLEGKTEYWLYPRTDWQDILLPEGTGINDLNPNFYITLEKML
ncbi:MAG: M1 family metallopeptidase [Sphingobacteriales bacterium]|nr:M1 family metallopeptidase [Sphingobacteriales bacterium]